MTLEEIVQTAMRIQPMILEEDKRDGASLRYVDSLGHFIIEQPDGTIERYDHIFVPEMEKPCQN